MNTEHPKRRLVRLAVDNVIIDSIFRTGYVPPMIVDGIPKDAVMVGTTFDPSANHVNVIYQHDSFAEICYAA